MASKKILINIQVSDANASKVINKTKGSVDALAAATKKLDNLQKQEAVDLEILNQQIKIQKQVNEAAAKSALGLGDATRSTTRAMRQGKAMSGLNNAILLESSRLASDAAYGFQGMANNLGQLVSLFQISADNAGGFRKTLVDVGKSILGTGGILIGIQLLISFLPRIVDFFSKSSKEADNFAKSIEDATKSLVDQKNMFDDLNEIRKNTNLGLDQLVKTYDRLKKKFPELEKAAKFMGIDESDEASLNNFLLKYADLQDARIAEAKGLKELEVFRQKIQAKQAELDDPSFLQSTAKLKKELNTLEDERTKSLARYNGLLDKTIELETEMGITGKLTRESVKTVREGLEGGLRTTPEILKKQREAVKKIIEGYFGTFSELNKENKKLFSDFADFFGERQDLMRESLKEITQDVIKESKIQSEAVNNMFEALMGTASKLGDLSQSFHEAELARLRSRKEVILADGRLTESERTKRIGKIEKQERAAEIRKIKAERDYFTLQQTFLIAQETMRIKFNIQEQIRMAQLMQLQGVYTMNELQLAAAKEIAEGQMSIGTFLSQLGTFGTIAFAATIGGVIASIVSARKKAQAQISSITGVSATSSGGSSGASGIAAPDFNVVGASETSQIGQALGMAQSNLTVDLYWSDVEKMNNQNRINTNMIQT